MQCLNLNNSSLSCQMGHQQSVRHNHNTGLLPTTKGNITKFRGSTVSTINNNSSPILLLIAFEKIGIFIRKINIMTSEPQF